MPVDRRFWTKYWFTGRDTPEWQCPYCNRGLLQSVSGTMKDGADYRSIRSQGHPDWDPEFWTGVFSGLLECNNDRCKGTVAVSGRADVGQEESNQLVTYFTPNMFTPPLRILPIPRECPKDVAVELREAFKLFWCDMPGAMNHLRKSVELIMDHLRIQRKKKNKARKMHRLDLHSRIDLFRAKNSDLADRLEAIKWLGNVGSHTGDVTQEQFFDACDLLEDFIHTHFEKRGRKIVALTRKVIKRKGRK